MKGLLFQRTLFICWVHNRIRFPIQDIHLSQVKLQALYVTAKTTATGEEESLQASLAWGMTNTYFAICPKRDNLGVSQQCHKTGCQKTNLCGQRVQYRPHELGRLSRNTSFRTLTGSWKSEGVRQHDQHFSMERQNIAPGTGSDLWCEKHVKELDGFFLVCFSKFFKELEQLPFPLHLFWSHIWQCGDRLRRFF